MTNKNTSASRVIYFDMDGVLAPFFQNVTTEQLNESGYFKNLPANKEMCEAVSKLLKIAPNYGYKIMIASKVLSDKAATEKRLWLDSEISPDIEAIFIPINRDKGDYIKNSKSSCLIDDYSPNLMSWDGVGIKAYTGENGTKGTWAKRKGAFIDTRWTAEQICESILEIIENSCRHNFSAQG